MCVDKEIEGFHLQFHHGSNWNQPLLILKNKTKPQSDFWTLTPKPWPISQQILLAPQLIVISSIIVSFVS